jgi:acyl-coenzyme A synthetase/AMP-(fatty) acid ligase
MIPQMFLRHAGHNPEACALRWHDEEISYRDLAARATAQRDRIQAIPLAENEPIGLHAGKSPEAIALVLGALLAERPFLLPSAALPQATLSKLFDAAGCGWVLTPDTLDRAGQSGTVPAGTTFMLTTSGSTGLPKVVPLNRDRTTAFTRWAANQFGIAPGRRVLNYSPLNFDLCLLDIWATLAHGGEVVLCDPAYGTDAKHLTRMLDAGAEVVQAVPMFYRLLIEGAHDRQFPAVRHAIFTGDSIPPRDLAELPRLFPNARLHNIYGCTETNDSFMYEVVPSQPPAGSVPLGAPLPGVHAVVIKQDGTVLTGQGTGELWVNTPFMTDGYLGTATDKFTAHGDRPYYRTGDLVDRGADGHLRLRGRTDFQAKVRGVRIDPQEVELVLLAHPAVREAAVLAVPAATGGHELHAVVTRAPGSDLNSLVLRAHCAQSLAPTAIPSALRITDLPLPRTSTGKVDRARVLEPSPLIAAHA